MRKPINEILNKIPLRPMLSRSAQLVFMNYLGARSIYANGGTLPFFLSLSLSPSVSPFVSRRARLCKECICINEAGCIYARRASRSTRCERALTVQPRHVREFTSALYLPLSRHSRTRFSSRWLHREAASPSPFALPRCVRVPRTSVQPFRQGESLRLPTIIAL